MFADSRTITFNEVAWKHNAHHTHTLSLLKFPSRRKGETLLTADAKKNAASTPRACRFLGLSVKTQEKNKVKDRTKAEESTFAYARMKCVPPNPPTNLHWV